MTAIIDKPISRADAAKLIGKSERWLIELVTKGYIKKTNDNKYTPREVATGALRAAADDKKTTDHSKAVAALAATRAKMAQLKLDQLAGTLINRPLMWEYVAELLGEFFAELTGLPAAFTLET